MEQKNRKGMKIFYGNSYVGKNHFASEFLLDDAEGRQNFFP